MKSQLTALVVFAALLGVPSAAHAAVGQTIVGDINGDAIADTVALSSSGGTCTATVSLGLAGGGYAAPVAHDWALPAGAGFAYCPDLGVIVDLGGDGIAELVLGWFSGSPLAYDLIVLRNFSPVTGFRAQFQPSGIFTADFNGDSRVDIWEVTDQGPGVTTYLNQPDGSLIPGPIAFPTLGLPSIQLAHFRAGGGTDMLATYRRIDGASYVSVYFGLDGSHVDLVSGDVLNVLSATIVDANGDGRSDVRVDKRSFDGGTTSTTYFINQGDGTFLPAPTARNDAASVGKKGTVVINVLANDVVTSAATVRIVSGPSRGTATVLADGTIRYVRRGGSPKPDQFTYAVTDGSSESVATVTITATR